MNTPQMHQTHFPGAQATCPVCKAAFTPKRSWQRFCSPPCRKAYHSAPDPVAMLRREVEELRERIEKIEGFLVL